MRKHRKWLMGFGIGIMLGASMLQLIQFARTQDQALMVADGTNTYTRQQLDEEVAKAVEEAKRQLPSPSPSPASGEGGGESALNPGGAAGTKPGGDASAVKSPSGTAPSSGASERVVAFYVNNGMDLKTVARSLKRLGVIDDAEDFTDEARTISKDIQPGTSEFKGKPTYKEIIAELTRPKDD